LFVVTVGFWVAAVEGQKATALLLLAQGKANLNARDNFDRTPLHWAAEWGRHEMVSFFFTRRQIVAVPLDKLGHTPLHRAVVVGKTAVINLLLKHYSVADVLRADNEGNTVFHLYARYTKCSMMVVVVVVVMLTLQ
jgi:ankyrin repeat protein